MNAVQMNNWLNNSEAGASVHSVRNQETLQKVGKAPPPPKSSNLMKKNGKPLKKIY